MTPEQADNWFTYHAPTPETAPKYALIRDAEGAAHVLFAELRGRAYPLSNPDTEPLTGGDCERVNATLRALAEVIDANAPDSADKTAAIRCVRLARNGANEFIMANAGGYPLHVDSLTLASAELQKARWQANGAIACNGL